MDSLFSRFSFAVEAAADDSKSLEPSRIDDLVHPFEVEARRSWSAVEAEHRKAAAVAERSVREAEEYLDSLMDAATAEFRRSNEEMRRLARAGSAAETTARALGNAASRNHASAARASARRGFSSSSSRVRPC